MSAGNCKILVIDDDANCADELCLVLAAAGFPAESESSAAGGMRRFLGEPDFRVVVSDIRMPDCNGIDLMKLIRGSCPRGATASLILVTGHPEERSINDVLKLGVSTILLKPLDPIKVVHAVSRAVDLHTPPESRSEAVLRRDSPQESETRKADPLDEMPLEDILAALRRIVQEGKAT
ncbi:MAG: response regulator [Telmatospirillum sp.]|nr:response regulator [Telmatospirillum sp.]